MTQRRAADVRGIVQGVGFRPFVVRLARAHGLGGFVRNHEAGVALEVEGGGEALACFSKSLVTLAPAPARIQSVRWREVAARGEDSFCVLESEQGAAPGPVLAPDLALCGACRTEVQSPTNRRAEHAFAHCAECGPRFTITRGPPYDRENTTMGSFPMCSECRREYGDPQDRRYHAQALACPHCGPSLRLHAGSGAVWARRDAALSGAIKVLRAGGILALKGLGGYQLLVRADGCAGVQRLRSGKARPQKPLALLVPDVERARALARIDDTEARLLRHSAAPIVLLRRHGGGELAPSVAPGTREIGLMLPATALHLLLAQGVGVPLVCTSGNRHGHPLHIDDAEALEHLGPWVDAVLAHDRAILRRADDSVVRVVGGECQVLRAGRGLTPRTFPLLGAEAAVLAVGAHGKQAPVLAADGRAVLWPHVGDLDTLPARRAMAQACEDLQTFTGVRAERLVTDLHPDYASSIWASEQGLPLTAVQHHHAHVAAVLAEHGENAALGFAWDGSGLGSDGTLWGGETLQVERGAMARVHSLWPFPLPGAGAAARDGRRALAGLCVAAELCPPDEDRELARLVQIASRPRLASWSSSVGRLFDAVAALTGVASRSSYEGEAALLLEALADAPAPAYPYSMHQGRLDWRPMLRAMLAERDDAPRVSARFHATLVAMIGAVVKEHRARTVVLTGGCFVNRVLLEGALARLAEDGVRVLISRSAPPGDGGLALGQVWVACGGVQACA